MEEDSAGLESKERARLRPASICLGVPRDAPAEGACETPGTLWAIMTGQQDLKALESEDFYHVFSPFSESACLGTVLIPLAEKPERINGVRDRKIENYSLCPFYSKPGQTVVHNILHWCFSQETHLKCHRTLKPRSLDHC